MTEAGDRAPGAALLAALGGRLAGFRGALQADAPLAPVVWFRAGGSADILALPADADDLALLMRALPDEVPVTVIVELRHRY